MDGKKIGNLILKLRKENKLTQKELAALLNISDKAISKWERGLGFPDVTLLSALAKIFQVDIEKILLGELQPKQKDQGNLKKIKFYTCSTCQNILTASTAAEISCCGRKLQALTEQESNTGHEAKIEQVENDYYLTFAHEMKKGHYLSFFAYISNDRLLLIKLYPEQSAEIRFPKMYGGKIYYYCTTHGLCSQDLTRKPN